MFKELNKSTRKRLAISIEETKRSVYESIPK